MHDDRFRLIEQLIAADPRERGIGALVQWGALGSAAQALAAAEKVGVMSGFYLPVPQAGETDGPPGAKAIAEALEALGIAAPCVTDAPHLPLFRAMGVEALEFAPEGLEDGSLEKLAPTHLVATERPGRAADGRYYSMSGRDLTPYTAPLDDWFLAAPERGIVTVAIGDGGNEIGMGNVRELVQRDVPNGEIIASVVPADHLIVAGVSNYGAYGLVAGLSLLAGRDLLPSPARALEDLDACVAAGACCGHTFVNAPLVDGMPASDTLRLLDDLRGILNGS